MVSMSYNVFMPSLFILSTVRLLRAVATHTARCGIQRPRSVSGSMCCLRLSAQRPLARTAVS